MKARHAPVLLLAASRAVLAASRVKPSGRLRAASRSVGTEATPVPPVVAVTDVVAVSEVVAASDVVGAPTCGQPPEHLWALRSVEFDDRASISVFECVACGAVDYRTS